VSPEASELYCLLIPLQSARLLVPRVCVAEVVAFSGPERPAENGELPGWYLGSIDWNGRRISVVSFEAMSGEPAQKRAGRTRIVVFHAIGDQLKTGFFGLITQGFPQLVRVNSDVLAPDRERGWPEEQPVLCRTRMINEYPMVPDMERLESMIAELSV